MNRPLHESTKIFTPETSTEKPSLENIQTMCETITQNIQSTINVTQISDTEYRINIASESIGIVETIRTKISEIFPNNSFWFSWKKI